MPPDFVINLLFRNASDKAIVLWEAESLKINTFLQTPFIQHLKFTQAGKQTRGCLKAIAKDKAQQKFRQLRVDAYLIERVWSRGLAQAQPRDVLQPGIIQRTFQERKGSLRRARWSKHLGRGLRLCKRAKGLLRSFYVFANADRGKFFVEKLMQRSQKQQQLTERSVFVNKSD